MSILTGKININTIARLAQNNSTVKEAVKWTLNFLLQLLSAQRLIDDRKLLAVSLDWERGTLDLGNNFVEQLLARAVSQHLIDRNLKKTHFHITGDLRADSDSAKFLNFDLKNAKK